MIVTVIVHYLDTIGKAPPIVPINNQDKIRALKLDALVQEVIDSLRLTSHENRREKNGRLPDYLEALDSKIKRGFNNIRRGSFKFFIYNT